MEKTFDMAMVTNFIKKNNLHGEIVTVITDHFMSMPRFLTPGEMNQTICAKVSELTVIKSKEYNHKKLQEIQKKIDHFKQYVEFDFSSLEHGNNY